MKINKSIKIKKFTFFLFFTNKIKKSYRPLQLRFFMGISHIFPLWRVGFKWYRKSNKEYHLFEKET